MRKIYWQSVWELLSSYQVIVCDRIIASGSMFVWISKVIACSYKGKISFAIMNVFFLVVILNTVCCAIICYQRHSTRKGITLRANISNTSSGQGAFRMITNDSALDRVEESYRRISIHTFKKGREADKPLVGESDDPPIYDNDETHMSPIYEMDDEMASKEDENVSGYASVPSARTSTTVLPGTVRTSTTALSGTVPASARTSTTALSGNPASGLAVTPPDIYDNVDQSIYEMDDVM